MLEWLEDHELQAPSSDTSQPVLRQKLLAQGKSWGLGEARCKTSTDLTDLKLFSADPTVNSGEGTYDQADNAVLQDFMRLKEQGPLLIRISSKRTSRSLGTWGSM